MLAVSVAGGDGQDQVTLQLLLNLIDFGLEPAEAVTRPAVHDQPLPRLVPPDPAESSGACGSTRRSAGNCSTPSLRAVTS